MLYRLMHHAGEYKLNEVLEMTVFDCAIVLGVDQHARPTLPYGRERVDENENVTTKLNTPTAVMVDPDLLASMNDIEFAPPL